MGGDGARAEAGSDGQGVDATDAAVREEATMIIKAAFMAWAWLFGLKETISEQVRYCRAWRRFYRTR